MKTQMIKNEQLILNFFRKLGAFFIIITSVFHYGQSFTSDNPAVYIREGTVLTQNYESKEEVSETSKENTSEIIITGKEHLHTANGAIVYGIKNISANTIKKNEIFFSRQQKIIEDKKEVSWKKTLKNKPSVPAQNIRTQPDQNRFYAASLSGQTVCVTPGSHYQNFIFYHTIRYVSAIQHDEYINTNYHYRYSVFSKNIIDGGGIRPPPFHC
ncbi:hypothetical protein [Chryseobacterium cheonjiense]|uniref:Uncharacterized protein n=1 Tax=Chryseobacterium cheonjiense TaxID=2728845 RepID=A0A7Y0AAA5_9FLAO|nr:hypothetical protein [Chryseobacterium cheonjiense]NML59383.1 hypothetical protein [Chryseobacterium cheonjiense]